MYINLYIKLIKFKNHHHHHLPVRHHHHLLSPHHDFPESLEDDNEHCHLQLDDDDAHRHPQVAHE